MEHKKEGTELCWLVYGGQIDGHRPSVPAEPDQVVSPARLHPEARDMSRRSCSLADGVEQAPGKTMKENESRGVLGLGLRLTRFTRFTRFTSRRRPFP